MIRAVVVMPWITKDNVYQPKLIIDLPLPVGGSFVDITSQQNIIPNPNLYLIEVVVTEEYLNAAETAGYTIITEETEIEVSAI